MQQSISNKTIEHNGKQILLPINFDNYTFRCSSLGKIMGNGRGKSPQQKYDEIQAKIDLLKAKIDEVIKIGDEKKLSSKSHQNNLEKMVQLKGELLAAKDELSKPIPLSETCISYLIEVYTQVFHGIKKDIYSKYMEKGKAKENEGIELLSEFHGNFYSKCPLPRQRNEYIEGELDILHEEEIEGTNTNTNLPELFVKKKVIDTKLNWDAFTFEKLANPNEEIKEGYEWQGIGYMELYDADEFQLAYVLCNMPSGLIEDERKRILYSLGSDMEHSQIYEDACREFLKKCTFDHLNIEDRIIDFFQIQRNKEKYLQVVERVIECRKWLNGFSMKRHRDKYGFIGGVNIEAQSSEVDEVISDGGFAVEENILGQSGTNFVELIEVETKSIDNIQTIIPTSTFEEIREVFNELVEQEENEFEKEQQLETNDEHKELESTIVEALKESQAIIEIKITPPTQEGEPFSTLSKVELCKNEKECLDLYKESRNLFVQFPQIKEALIAKKAQFNPPPPPIEQEVKVQPAPKTPIPTPTPTPKPTKTPPPKKEEAKQTTKDAVYSEGSLVEVEKKIAEIKELVLKCTTSVDVRNIYQANKDFVAQNRESGLKKWIEGIFLDLEKKEKEVAAGGAQ